MQETELLARDIPSAIADAIYEHESWMEDWRRTALCGLPPGNHITGENAHLTCRFGRWFAHNSETGMLQGKLLHDLGSMHGELHEAGRYLMAKLKDGEQIPADEYDAFMDVAHNFQKIAARIQDLHGCSDQADIDVEDELVELQSRLNMLTELEREWERAARAGKMSALIMVRPDGLEEIHATYGQIGVDRVFASLAARLYSHLRPYDSVFRYGRNEYLICIPETDHGRAADIARRLDRLLADDPVALSDEVEAEVTARFGFALSDRRCSVQEVLDRAARAVNLAGSAERVVAWTAERDPG